MRMELAAFVTGMTILSVYEAGATYLPAITVIGNGSFAPSYNISISVSSDGVNYSVKTKHFSGDRKFGSNNTDPKIHYIAAPVGAIVTDTTTPTFDYSAWTTL